MGGHLLDIRRRHAGRAEQAARHGGEQEQGQAKADEEQDRHCFAQYRRGGGRRRAVDASRPYRLRDPYCGGGVAVIISFSCVFYCGFLLPLVFPAPLYFSAAVRCAVRYGAGRQAAALPYPACGRPG